MRERFARAIAAGDGERYWPVFFDRLRELAAEHGARFAPAPLLGEVVESDGSLTRDTADAP